MEMRVNPTRMELKKLQARYATARRGHKLLKDKCDGLMQQFLEIVRRARTLRAEIEQFAEKNLPAIYALIARYGAEKRVVIFKSREEADAFLSRLKRNQIP